MRGSLGLTLGIQLVAGRLAEILRFTVELLTAVTCIRATTRTVWNNGVLETVAINTPAFTDGVTLSVADSATNYLLNSDAPVTQTTQSLNTGFYTLSVYGTGSALASGNTATITGAASATEGSPDTFEVTVAGTVDVTVTGSLDYFQLEGGSAPSPLIITAGAPVTRAADQNSIPTPSVVGDSWAIEFLATPNKSGQTAVILASYVSLGVDEVRVVMTPAAVELRKRVAGTAYSAVAIYVHAGGTKLRIQMYGGSAGTGVRAADASADISAVSFMTNANTLAAPFGTTISLGHIIGSNIFSSDIDNPTFYSSKEAAGW